MNPREFVTNKIIDPIEATGNSTAFLKPKNSTVIVRLISLFGVLSSVLLSFIPDKIGIREMFAAAYAQQQQAISDPLSDSLQIAQSKVQAETSPGAFGHGVPSLYSISIQDLLMILGITGLGCILVYLIVRILLNRTKEKEDKMVLYQQ
jgi:hypothetical protein